MKEEINEIHPIIIRYLDNSATLEEKKLLLHWLKQSDDNRTDFTLTRDLWLSCNAVMGNELEVDIALGKLKDRILKEQRRIERKSTLREKTGTAFARWMKAAVIIVLAIGAGYGISNWKQPSFEKIVVKNQLITGKGSKGKFILPDGSLVWLNSESKLVYADRFAGNKRVVELEGEAYFEITPNKEKPFIVQAGEIEVEVLGTTFNIDSYSSEEYIQAALLSGSIKITGKAVKEPVYLKPDQLFKYQKAGRNLVVEKAKAGLYAGWIKDQMVFDNDLLSDILISMESRYNVHIECAPSLASSTRLSFTIRQESIEEVLQSMSLIAPLKYKITNQKIDITPR